MNYTPGLARAQSQHDSMLPDDYHPPVDREKLIDALDSIWARHSRPQPPLGVDVASFEAGFDAALARILNLVDGL